MTIVFIAIGMSAMQPTNVLKPSRQPPPSPRGVRSVVAFVKEVASRFSSDRCTTLGASVAFYCAFSLAPTLLIVLAIIGWFFGRDAAQGKLFNQIKGILGADAASAIQSIVEHAHHSGNGGIAALISVVLLAIGASATFSSLNTALDVVFRTSSPKGLAGVALLLRARLVSLGLVLGLAFLLVVSLVLDAAVQTVGNALFGSIALTVFAELAQTLLGLVILTVGLGALIKWLPDTHVAVRPSMIGGLVAAVLFTVGRHLFGLYLAHAGTAGSFGAAGSLAVLMMWLYFCAAVFLLGAEVVAVLNGTPSRDDSDTPLRVPVSDTATRR
jgi:membrane protein